MYQTLLTEIHIHTALEKPAKDFKHLSSGDTQLACKSKVLRYVLSIGHRLGHPFLEETQFGTLRYRMAHCQFNHMITTS